MKNNLLTARATLIDLVKQLKAWKAHDALKVAKSDLDLVERALVDETLALDLVNQIHNPAVREMILTGNVVI